MIIFLGILIGLVLLLCIRVTLLVHWASALDLWVCWLFLKIPLKKKEKSKAQLAKDAEKKAKKKRTGNQTEKPKKPGEPRALEDTIAMVLDLVSSATGPLHMLLRNLRVGLLELRVTVAEDDPAETAIRCGQINAYLYGAYATFANIIKIRRADIQVAPDFLVEQGGFALKMRVSIMPIVVLGAALRFGAQFLWNAAKNSADDKQAPLPAKMAQQEQSSTVETGRR